MISPSDTPLPATYYIGFCRQCGTGPLGLRTCGDCGNVLVVCDECDSAWVDGEVDQLPATTGVTTLPCPHCQSDVFEEPGHWSTPEELLYCQWLNDSIGRGDVTVHTSLTPPPEDDSVV
ncbi:hypothetical protein [Aeoliella sp. SH292]|uniref:hypothetical protein n=1 Tax=Aeoliella sp. SH292 TaxID=3454464 RepID=UPI003F99B07D